MSRRPLYEVFLSFRGPDTRRDFADFLYNRLKDVGIGVFRDKEELQNGKELRPELIRAIQQSKISIPIISREFASSTSCLMELEQMVKCMDNNGHIIIPIFYYVEPSHVRSCKGCFKESLNGHKKRDRGGRFVNSWKSALQRIGNLKGTHLCRTKEMYHGEVIRQIVREVEQMLRKRDLIVPEQLVGVDPHVQCIMAKLKFDYHSGQAVKIGDKCEKVLIYGIPGVGKTVLAKFVYNQLHHLYEACSFVEKIQEKIRDCGIVSVQNRLISDLHKRNAPKFTRYDDAMTYIQSRFYSMKVLVLLDDVKDDEELSELVGALDWLGPGSTVILTSQRQDVHGHINGVESFFLQHMKEDEALKLFCRHAFGTDSPPEKFKELSANIVAVTDGLPLALEKVGKDLFEKRRKKVWMEKLNALKKAPHSSVRAAFFKSYTTLDEHAQQIFLDIACFFNGKDKRIPYYMWHDLEFSPSLSILALNAMSLVEIGEDQELCMRGILKIFGKEIVKSENKNEPCKRSRLCNHEEALDVLKEKKGTRKVKALGLEFGDGSEGNTIFKCNQFDGLQNLRFLKLDQANIQGKFGDRLSKLMWLDWQGCPKIFDVQSLNLNLQKLVILDLSWSQVDRDWRGWELLKQARKLKVLKLTGCVQLIATPKFPASMELERLILEGCSKLAVIDQSFDNLMKLVSLNMKQCSCLHESVDLGPKRGLKELVIDETSISRINFQEDSMMMLKNLSARHCKKLTNLSYLIPYLRSLKYLSLDSSGIVTLGESIGPLEKLKTLSLKNCKGLSYLPDGIEKLKSLQFLDLSGTEICTLPEFIGSLGKLNTLSLKKCRRLLDLPDGIGKLRSLQFLDLSYTKIHTLGESIESLKQLKTLSLKNCRRLSNLPDDIGKLRSLQFLDLSSTMIQELPPSVEDLKAMEVLRMRETFIQEFPKAILNLEKLEEIDFSLCRNLEGRIPDDISRLSSLAILKLSDTRISGVPPSISHLSRLQELDISGCDHLQSPPKLPFSLVNDFRDSGI